MDVSFLCNSPDLDGNYVWDYFTILKSDSIHTAVATRDYGIDKFSIRNSPNPFSSSTNISYYLPTSGAVKIGIYDSLGRNITTLLDGPRETGNHMIEWPATDKNGHQLSNGIYFAHIYSNEISKITKMMFIQE